MLYFLLFYYIFLISTGERPFVEIISDRWFWLIHVVTIFSIFIVGLLGLLSGYILLLFGSIKTYYSLSGSSSIFNDRFSDEQL